MSRLLFDWRDRLLSIGGPPPTRRLVLIVLSTYGDQDGADIYPSTRELARATGLSRRRVEGHLREAVEEGWITRHPIGEGRQWKRMRYALAIPADVETKRPHADYEGGDGASPRNPVEVETKRPHKGQRGGDVAARGGDVADTEVGTERPTTSVVTSPQTSPVTPPEGAARAAPNWPARAVEVWKERMGGTYSHGRMGKALKPAVEEHGEEPVLAAFDGYLARLVGEGRGEFATPQNFAERIGLELNGNGKARPGRPKEVDQEDVAGWNQRSTA